MSDVAGTVSERLFRALAVERDSVSPPLEDLAAITLWGLRENFLEELAAHSSPRQAGECVWQQCEPWISAVGDVVDGPDVLLAEVADWAALLELSCSSDRSPCFFRISPISIAGRARVV